MNLSGVSIFTSSAVGRRLVAFRRIIYDVFCMGINFWVEYVVHLFPIKGLSLTYKCLLLGLVMSGLLQTHSTNILKFLINYMKLRRLITEF